MTELKLTPCAGPLCRATVNEQLQAKSTTVTTVSIPDSVTTIGDKAFSGCTSLTRVYIPDSVTSIVDGAFHGCTSLTSVCIPESVTTIGNGAFSVCTSLTSVYIPKSVTSIDCCTFSDCTSLACVHFAGNVEKIDSNAFSDCASLACVHFAGNVENIYSYAFSMCENLASVYLPGSPDIDDKAFDKSTCIISTAQAHVNIGNRLWRTQTPRDTLMDIYKNEGLVESIMGLGHLEQSLFFNRPQGPHIIRIICCDGEVLYEKLGGEKITPGIQHNPFNVRRVVEFIHDCQQQSGSHSLFECTYCVQINDSQTELLFSPEGLKLISEYSSDLSSDQYPAICACSLQ